MQNSSERPFKCAVNAVALINSKDNGHDTWLPNAQLYYIPLYAPSVVIELEIGKLSRGICSMSTTSKIISSENWIARLFISQNQFYSSLVTLV